uniref:Uncharacterized protein n=1 Tax=Odontella aurita TaxID=265563 RepID=A0A7S4MLW6_9STRA|mmetsp:Transcript_25318/g.74493  ORF Transcript_25318/g.74493 Transcript_25318/m.74493 type:complete len:369 (+) Transcript_25318:758-1864(+)
MMAQSQTYSGLALNWQSPPPKKVAKKAKKVAARKAKLMSKKAQKKAAAAAGSTVAPAKPTSKQLLVQQRGSKSDTVRNGNQSRVAVIDRQERNGTNHQSVCISLDSASPASGRGDRGFRRAPGADKDYKEVQPGASGCDRDGQHREDDFDRRDWDGHQSLQYRDRVRDGGRRWDSRDRDGVERDQDRNRDGDRNSFLPRGRILRGRGALPPLGEVMTTGRDLLHVVGGDMSRRGTPRRFVIEKCMEIDIKTKVGAVNAAETDITTPRHFGGNMNRKTILRPPEGGTTASLRAFHLLGGDLIGRIVPRPLVGATAMKIATAMATATITCAAGGTLHPRAVETGSSLAMRTIDVQYRALLLRKHSNAANR